MARLVARGLRALADWLAPATPQGITVNTHLVLDGKELARALVERRNGGTY